MPTKSNNTGGRGGKRPGAGRKKSAVKEKYENGNPGGRKLEVLDIPDTQGEDMPEPHEFLSAKQHDGSTLEAADIYRETWKCIFHDAKCMLTCIFILVHRWLLSAYIRVLLSMNPAQLP